MSAHPNDAEHIGALAPVDDVPLHEWDVVNNGSTERSAERMRVPGGWVYKVGCWGETEAMSRPVFVPDPQSPPAAAPALTLDDAAAIVAWRGQFNDDVERTPPDRAIDAIFTRLLGNGGAA